MSKEDLQDFLKDMKYEEKKSELAYKVNIDVLSLQRVIVGVYPYKLWLQAAHKQTIKAKKLALVSFMHVRMSVTTWKRWYFR